MYQDSPRALEETAAFFAALLDAMQRARAAYPDAQWTIRHAAELVIGGYAAVDPMGPCRCREHAGPAPTQRCRHAWATVLFAAATQGLQPAHWDGAETPAVREARAAQSDLVAHVASDVAAERTDCGGAHGA